MRRYSFHDVFPCPKDRLKRGVLLFALAAACLASAPRLRAGEAPIPVVDLHVDLPYQVGYQGRPFSEGLGEFRASDLEEAGVFGVVLPLFVPTKASPKGRTLEELEASYARVYDGIVATPPYSLPGCGVRRAATATRAVSTWLSFEGAEPVPPDRVSVARWAARGVRVFGLIHVEDTVLGTSSGGKREGRGLTARGRTFADSVVSVGGVLDVSHLSDAATDEMIALGRKRGVPVVATHSNARHLAQHPRNLTDRQIRGIAETGGVIGINFHRTFLRGRPEEASLADVLRHVRHVARLGGEGVVAVGSDFEGGIRPARQLESVRGYQELAEALHRDGWSRASIQAFFSGNALRVLCPKQP